MKLRIDKDKDILRLLGIGVGLLLIGSLLLTFRTLSIFNSGVGIGLILGGVFTIIASIYVAALPKDNLIADERSIRTDEKAAHHAFWILLSIMGFVQLIDVIWKLDFEFRAVVSFFFTVGIWLWIILRWHYNRKGEEM